MKNRLKLIKNFKVSIFLFVPSPPELLRSFSTRDGSTRDECKDAHRLSSRHENRFCELCFSPSYLRCSWTIEWEVRPGSVVLSIREFNVLTNGTSAGSIAILVRRDSLDYTMLRWLTNFNP